MKTFITQLILLLTLFKLGNSYSKYGRTCKDIGCTSSEVCVMAEDPCSYYNRGNDCGSYPTCQKVNNGGPSCATYVCPPTRKCIMDGSTPKCVEDRSSSNEFSSIDEKKSVPNHSPNNQPSAPLDPSGGNVYPNLRPGQTTPRSPAYRPGHSSGGGYQGGAVGSGYPGQPPSSGRYPAQGGGYPGGYYPQSGGGGYPQYGGGYPQQGGGYPQGGRYPQGGYAQGGSYPGYPGQSSQGRYPYGSNNQRNGAESSFLDGVWKGLKNIGLFCLVANYIMKLAFGFT